MRLHIQIYINFASLYFIDLDIITCRMPLKTRLFYLFISWLPAGLIYIATSTVTGQTWIVPESWIERFIPFSPYGIWLYLLFYVYIPYTFITVNGSKVKIMSFAFVITTCISGMIFILLPSTTHFPDFKTDGISAYILNFVGENDTEQNCFPSMHGSLITICTLANWDKIKKVKSYGCILLTVMMYYSIIQVRRHVFIDLAAGIMLALFAWQLAKLVLHRSKGLNNIS